METIAVYWEPKPKIYGLNEVKDLLLLDIVIKDREMLKWGFRIQNISDLGINFHLILTKYSNHKELQLYILLEKFQENKILTFLKKQINLKVESDFKITSPVELIYFQGPHFGDRYGIADAVFKSLDNGGIPILISVCSEATVFIVLPEKSIERAGHCLTEAFITP